MDEEIKQDVISEASLAVNVDPTSAPYLNEIKNEFSFSEPHLHGSLYTGENMNLMEEDVKPEVTFSEASLAAIVDPTSDVHYVNHIKKELSLSESNSHGVFVKNAGVKHEDTSIELLDLEVKSEVPDLKFCIKNGNDETYIKLEKLVSEELHIKSEIGQTSTEQTIKKPAQGKLFYCGVCNRKFTWKSNLQQHMKTHTEDKPFQCSVCDYRCAQKSNLQTHIRAHTRENLFKCSLCYYKCAWKTSLQHHMKTHTGEKPFKCNICDYGCIQKISLLNHIKTHTGEKPYSCSLCEYKCVLKSTLQQHMKTHTGEKPFQCNLCDYKCRQKSTLQKHMKTHTGEKPFKCNLCDYRCIQKSSLQRHIKTHTFPSNRGAQNVYLPKHTKRNRT